MEFDKTRVYTEFTADEVKIGSRGYFSNTKGDMLEFVKKESNNHMGELVRIYDSEIPFEWNGCYWRYFYLVEEPKEKTKRPCTREELIEMLKRQGLSMLKLKKVKDNYTVDVRSLTDNEITLESGTCFKDYKELCEYYTLLDGTELWVEE